MSECSFFFPSSSAKLPKDTNAHFIFRQKWNPKIALLSSNIVDSKDRTSLCGISLQICCIANICIETNSLLNYVLFGFTQTNINVTQKFALLESVYSLRRYGCNRVFVSICNTYSVTVK